VANNQQAKDLVAHLKTGKEYLGKIEDQYKDLKKLVQETATEENKRAIIISKIAEQEAKKIELLKSDVKLHGEILAIEKQLNEFRKDRTTPLNVLTELETQKKLLEKLQALSKEEKEERISGIRALQAYNTALQQTVSLEDDIVQSVAKIFDRKAKMQDSFIGKLVKYYQLQQQVNEGDQDAADSLAQRLNASGFTVSNVVITGLESLIDDLIAALMAGSKSFVSTLDESISALNKLAGYDRSMSGIQDEFVGLFHATNDYSTSLEDLTDITQSFIENYTDFLSMSANARGELMEFAAMMENLGVSTKTTATLFQEFDKNLGMSTEQSSAAVVRLAGVARSLGLSMSATIESFSDALPGLSQWGEKAIDVFSELQVITKTTGASTKELLSIAEGFDTFQTAADKVGQLNAILGGPYLNAIKMVSATEAERVQLIMQSIHATGRSWEELGRFEKKAVAAAAGINDMSLANKVLGGSLKTYEEYSRQLDDAAVNQEEMERAAKANVTMQQDLTRALHELLMGLEPLLDTFRLFASVLKDISGWLSDNLHPWFLLIVIALAKVGFWLFSLATASGVAFGPITALSGAMRRLTATMAANPAAAAAMIQAQGAAAAASTAAAAASRAAALNILAYGAVVLAIAAAVYIMVQALLQIVEAVEGNIGVLIAGSSNYSVYCGHGSCCWDFSRSSTADACCSCFPGGFFSGYDSHSYSSLHNV